MVKQPKFRRPTVISACLVVLISGLMVGCGSEGDADPAASDQPEAAESAGTPPDASPEGTAPENASAQPGEAAPQATGQANPTAGIQGRDILCSTPSQTAQVTWQDAEPLITVTQKPYQPILEKASPVAIQENDDSSVTYGYLQEPTAYIKTFDNGNCMVQTLDAQGNVTTEEYGRTS